MAIDTALRRDARVMSLIGVAHFISHFCQLALPPLFPLLREEFGVSWVALGVVMSVFYTASGVGQAACGFLVDRYGAPRILVAGTAVLAGAIGSAGLVGSYWALVGVALVAGLGNSVYHPADFAILNASIDPGRIGRSYSVHGLSGMLGYAAAPATIGALASLLGWRPALVAVGILGAAVAVLLAAQSRHMVDHRAAAVGRDTRRPGLVADLRLLLATPIVMAFVFFVLLATALIGLQTFAVAAFMGVYDVPLAHATGLLTTLLLGNAAGIVLGGVLADRTSRHDVVAGSGLLLTAAFLLAVAGAVSGPAALPAVVALAGVCLGTVSPSRDMLIRAATPPGATGKVYGFVYSALDVGSAIAPVLFAWLIERGDPRAVFALAALLLVGAIPTVLQVRRHSMPAVARP